MSLVRMGLIAVVISIWLVYLAFSRALPWQTGFQVNAVFRNAVNVRVAAAVRIAGVNVGKVTGAEHVDGSPLTTVSMQIEDNGLPIHADATAKIRARTFLEGNYFVDLRPGTPSAPELKDGDTIPVGQTAAGVQFDEILTGLQADTRKQLQRFLQDFGAGLDNGEPQKGNEADEGKLDRSGTEVAANNGGSEGSSTTGSKSASTSGSGAPPAGQTAGEAINRAFKNGATGLKATAQTNEALRGTESGDLTRWVQGLNKTVRGLDQNEVQLQDLITNLNITSGALASVSGDLSASVRELPRTLGAARPALAHLNEALPPLREFASGIRPGIRDLPQTIAATTPWIDQFTLLAGPDELGGAAKLLRESTPSSASFGAESLDLLPQVDDASRCFAEVMIPVGNQKVNDPPFTNSFPPTESYKFIAYNFAGLASIGQSFDGNGYYARAGQSGGSTTITTGPINGAGVRLTGEAPGPFQGFRPKYPGKAPPLKPDVACHKNTVPDLNGAQTAPGQ